jgi:hypothetical protein
LVVVISYQFRIIKRERAFLQKSSKANPDQAQANREARTPSPQASEYANHEYNPMVVAFIFLLNMCMYSQCKLSSPK